MAKHPWLDIKKYHSELSYYHKEINTKNYLPLLLYSLVSHQNRHSQ